MLLPFSQSKLKHLHLKQNYIFDGINLLTFRSLSLVSSRHFSVFACIKRHGSKPSILLPLVTSVVHNTRRVEADR